jgi:hypothetical protein
MKDRLLILFTTLAAIGALAIAGCGGDDDTSSTTGASGASGVSGAALTEDEWVQQADQICAAGDKDIDQAANDTFGGQQPSQAEIEQFANDTLIPNIQAQLDAIQALTPPEEIADDATQLVDDANAALDEIRDDPSLVAASSSEDPFAEVNKEAQALGLHACGNG